MEVFIVQSKEIEGRIDSLPYHPVRIRAVKRVKSSKFPLFPLKEVVEFRRELVTTNPDNLPYVGLENIESDTGRFLESEEKKEDFGTAAKFNKGDLLFPKLRPYLNKVHMAEFEGVCSTEFYVLKSMKCNNKYLFAFLNSKIVVDQTTYLMTGNTLPRLQTEDVEKIHIPIPPLETQQKIVRLMDDAYAEKRKKKEEARQLTNSINNVLDDIGISLPKTQSKKCYAVHSNEASSRLDPFYYKPEFIEFDQNIKKSGVNFKRLDEVAKVICGPFGSSITVKDYLETGVPLIRIQDINENKEISMENLVYVSEKLAEELKNYRVKENDLIISQRGTLGLTARIPKSLAGAIISANFIAIKDVHKELLSDFLDIFLSSEYGKIQLIRHTSGQIQTKITTDDVKSIKIPIPPLAVQNRIASEVRSRMEKADSLRREAASALVSARSSVEGLILGT